MTPQEAANELGLHRDSVYRALRDGRLHGFKTSRGIWMIDPQEVQRYRWRRAPMRSTAWSPLIRALISN